MRIWYRRIQDGFRRRSVVTRFDEEMAFHREQLEADYQRQGLSAEEARFAAARDLGNGVQSREAIRERTGLPQLEDFGRDLATSFRGLVKRRLFSISVILILASGMGAASVVHGLVASFFLRPLSVPHPDQIYSVASNAELQVSRGTVARAGDNLGANHVGGYSAVTRVATVHDGREPVSAHARLVTGSFFETLRLHAAAGRLIEPRDDVPGNPNRIVALSHSWAAREFGKPDSALGKTVLVNGQALSVVGVLPPAFRDVAAGAQVDLWFPTALQSTLGFSGNAHAISSDDRSNNPDFCREERVAWLSLLLRLDPTQVASAAAGVRQAYAAQAAEWVRAIDDPREQNAVLQRPWTLLHTPRGAPEDRRQQKALLGILSGIVATLLLLSCANVSGLLLVRTMSRHRELGVRLALGAGAWRTVRLVTSEAFLLCAAAGVLGLLLASWIPLWVTNSGSGWSSLMSEIHLDSLAFSFAVIVVCTGISAIAPVLFITRLGPSVVITGSAASLPSPGRVGRTLVVAQLALTMVLVAIAFSLGKELQETLSRPFGLDAQSVLTTALSPEQVGLSTADITPVKQRLQKALESVANVEQIAFASNGVMVGSVSRSGIHPRGDKARISGGHYQSDSVSSSYFPTMGLTLLRGRSIETTDTTESSRVAVVTAALAKELFGSIDVVGERFGFDHTPSPQDWTIVGVVADARVNGARSTCPPMFFVPQSQFNPQLRFVAVRVHGDVEAARKALAEALASAEPRFKGSPWKTLQQRARDGLNEDRTALSLAAIVAGIALLLSGIGASASLSYLVLTKRKELAIRLAIGASPGSLVRGVLGEAVSLTVGGTVLGVVSIGCLQLAPRAAALFAKTTDFSVNLTAAAVVLMVSVIAALFPARRAARTDPLAALKAE